MHSPTTQFVGENCKTNKLISEALETPPRMNSSCVCRAALRQTAGSHIFLKNLLQRPHQNCIY